MNKLHLDSHSSTLDSDEYKRSILRSFAKISFHKLTAIFRNINTRTCITLILILIFSLLAVIGALKVFSLLNKLWTSVNYLRSQLPNEDAKFQLNLLVEITKTAVLFLGTIGAITAGIGVFFNIRTAQRNARISEERLENERHYNRERSITERFSKAIEQLGSQKIEVRLGGIYSLERISQDSPERNHWTVMEILTSFIQEKSPSEPQKNDREENKKNFSKNTTLIKANHRNKGEKKQKITTDIQAALTVIGRRNSKNDPADKSLDLALTNLSRAHLKIANLERVNLEEANLARANLVKAHLGRSDLAGANLEGTNLGEANLETANLVGANLEEANLVKTDLGRADLAGANLVRTDLGEANLARANLVGANLEEANLVKTYLGEAYLMGSNLEEANLMKAHLGEANLAGAYLVGANLEGANLREANLREAFLGEANLEGANLEGANLEGANLERANLEGANLERANLEGANLERANLEGANLERAHYDKNTKLPNNFNPTEAKMRLDPNI